MPHQFWIKQLVGIVLIIVSGSSVLAQGKTIDRGFYAKAETLDDQADQLYREGKYAEAITLLEEAIGLSDKAYGSEPGPFTAQLMQRSANLYMLVGKMERAQELLLSAKEKHWLPIRAIAKANGNKEMDGALVEMIIDCDIYLINILIESGQFHKSLAEVSAAEKLRNDSPPNENDTAGLNQIATLKYLRGVSRQRLGDLADARRCIEEAIAMHGKAQAGEVTHETIMMNLQLGQLLQEQLDYKRANEVLSSSLKDCAKVFPWYKYPNGHPYTIRCLAILGLNAAHRGDYAASDRFLRRAESGQRKISNDQADNVLADIQNKRGVLAQLQGNFVDAESSFSNALETRKTLFAGKAHPDLADSFHNMGGVLVAQGKYDAALENINESLRIWSELLPKGALEANHPSVSKGLAITAMCFFAAGDPQAAVEPSGKALAMHLGLTELFSSKSSEAESLDFVTELSILRSQYISVCLAAHQPPDYKLLWRHKALAFAVLSERAKVAKALATSDVDLKKSIVKWQMTRTQLSGLLLARDAFFDLERSRRINELTREKESLERSLAERIQMSVPNEPFQTFIASLDDQMVFVDCYEYFHITPDSVGSNPERRYLAFCVVKGRDVQVIELGVAKSIDECVEVWRTQISQEIREEGAAQVANFVLNPIKEKTQFRRNSRVVVSPDGNLAKIPWSALPLKSEGELLIEHSSVSLVPNAVFLGQQLSKKLERSANTKYASGLIVADIDFGSSKSTLSKDSGTSFNFSKLNGTRKEADLIRPRIEGLTGSKVVEISGLNATTTSVLKQIEMASLAHVATHGISLPEREALFSFAGLAAWATKAPNGVRMTGEARNPLACVALALSGANIPEKSSSGLALLSGESIASSNASKCRLVVLSACSSATGNEITGEGTFGLQRAFHLAGAENVIGTLWSISDSEAPTVAFLFYHSLAKGSSPSEALRKAQIAMIHGKELSELLVKEGSSERIESVVIDLLRGGDTDFEVNPKNAKSTPLRVPRSTLNRVPTKHWAAFTLSGLGD